ncbi:hypothetical protein [Sandaracinus amylolyticus]|uniref:Uncharacterized protein n=1 Tax=Sandaracinus amylolyticus TaxID=927083 RepID=A0A0F6YM25_9BACT|nr:hypothetical protein [Sandaracinus amylolyticus]AKF08957.1 hypothetical protein DB32_006106 [Sandaracinus amylolyticus]
MRLHRTPAHWRPQGAPLRFVSFGDQGRPWWSIAIAIGALALAVVLGVDVVEGLMRPSVRVPMFAILLPLASLAVAIGCAYAAADRLLRGPDGAVELDVARRAMLILRTAGIEGARPADPDAPGYRAPTALELAFDGIESIAVARQQVITQYVWKHSGEKAYRESTTVLRVLALPMGVVLLRDEIPHAVARDRASRIAAAIGVPVRDLG